MKERNQNEMIAVAVAIVVVVIILSIGILNTISRNTAQNTNKAVETKKTNMEQALDAGLIIKDVVVGEGEEAVDGMKVTTNYVGKLDDGTVFDSSIRRGVPFSFTLGVGQVIKGWDLGIKGMKVGGKRELTIPADLAYGNRAIGAIPANSTLHFEVELLGVEKK